MTLMPCGTRAAYQRHLRHDEPACDACRDAMNAYSKPRIRARSRAQSRLVEIKRPEFKELLADERARRGGIYQAAWNRARVRLALNHDDLFRPLLAEELAKEGLR
jgi:hypothetical protein